MKGNIETLEHCGLCVQVMTQIFSFLIIRQKLVEDKFYKEKEIGRRFRSARTQLEEGLKVQGAAIAENYGTLNTREHSLSRKYFIRSRSFPQPIEVLWTDSIFI